MVTYNLNDNRELANPGSDDFKLCFQNTETQTKLNILKQLLSKNSDLQSQFMAFAWLRVLTKINSKQKGANDYIISLYLS